MAQQPLDIDADASCSQLLESAPQGKPASLQLPPGPGLLALTPALWEQVACPRHQGDHSAAEAHSCSVAASLNRDGVGARRGPSFYAPVRRWRAAPPVSEMMDSDRRPPQGSGFCASTQGSSHGSTSSRSSSPSWSRPPLRARVSTGSASSDACKAVAAVGKHELAVDGFRSESVNDDDEEEEPWGGGLRVVGTASGSPSSSSAAGDASSSSESCGRGRGRGRNSRGRGIARGHELHASNIAKGTSMSSSGSSCSDSDNDALLVTTVVELPSDRGGQCAFPLHGRDANRRCLELASASGASVEAEQSRRSGFTRVQIVGSRLESVRAYELLLSVGLDRERKNNREVAFRHKDHQRESPTQLTKRRSIPPPAAPVTARVWRPPQRKTRDVEPPPRVA
eukprot:TRINITY_DN27857_c0_g1_i1.p1 TRINITY_DN27857_c0_g1~~TRINITY_DN27857_c0_g1_i1.p1  ORF type:complete len:396 (-),score=60.62 TRINITY_DN27857_c0_g1_i1:9-1196(-)